MSNLKIKLGRQSSSTFQGTAELIYLSTSLLRRSWILTITIFMVRLHFSTLLGKTRSTA